MTTVIDATFDGEVFRPAQPVELRPNTQVRLRVESSAPTSENSAPTAEVSTPESDEQEGPPPKLGEPYSFLKVLRSIKLDGPPDWSANIDKYLYGELHAEEPPK